MLHKMIRVLVADDSAIAREVVNEGIKPHRNTRYIEVDNVDNGQSALELLKRKQVDIAFIDINMPGLNGPEVVAAMRDTKSIDCLTVAMSSDLDASGRKRCSSSSAPITSCASRSGRKTFPKLSPLT